MTQTEVCLEDLFISFSFVNICLPRAQNTNVGRLDKELLLPSFTFKPNLQGHHRPYTDGSSTEREGVVLNTKRLCGAETEQLYSKDRHQNSENRKQTISKHSKPKFTYQLSLNTVTRLDCTKQALHIT